MSARSDSGPGPNFPERSERQLVISTVATFTTNHMGWDGMGWNHGMGAALLMLLMTPALDTHP